MMLTRPGPSQTFESIKPSSRLFHRLPDVRPLPSDGDVNWAGVGEPEPARQLVVDLPSVACQPIIAQKTILGGGSDRKG